MFIKHLLFFKVIEILLLEEWTDDYDDVYGDENDSNEPTKPDAANQALVAAARFNQKQVSE